jgi:hypothetical protein
MMRNAQRLWKSFNLKAVSFRRGSAAIAARRERIASHPNAPHWDNEFYKKGCQEKTSPSTGGREDLCLEIQPTVGKRAPRFGREVWLWLVCRSQGFHLSVVTTPIES